MTGFICRPAATLVAVAACFLITARAQPPQATLLDTLLSRLPVDCQLILSERDRFNVQILYTQINRDERNRPRFTTFAYHVDPQRYFYPASLVKLPLSALALDKINRIHVKGLKRETPTVVNIPAECPIAYDSAAPLPGDDPKRPSNAVSIESSIKRMLLVSDNRASNRLWEFLTPDYIPIRLQGIGFNGITIIHRLWPCSAELNRMSFPVLFIGKNGKPFYRQPPTVLHQTSVNPLSPISIGKAYIQNGAVVPRPYAADNLNYASIEDLHRFLMMVFFPTSFERKRRLLLSPSDYRFLWAWMSLLPSESDLFESSDRPPDNLKKYFLYGNDAQPFGGSGLREFNVVGKAYGFIGDVAYFADFREMVEFFLSAVMYANQDDVINDDCYDYETLALPFFRSLASEIYEYEKKRPRNRVPDLRKFEQAVRAAAGHDRQKKRY
jgi:hypothetical protein